jgi:HAD superfamily hydrolase (TIGR01509 family)
MIKAVLLDLDNTLAHNPDAAFARAFLALLEQYFRGPGEQPYIRPFVQAIRGLGSADRNMRMTNAQAIVKAIQDETGQPESAIAEAIQRFYQQTFPHLQDLIHPVGGAADFVQHLMQKKVAVVIATNPLHPLEAVETRLRWAGLPNDGYALITHAGNMHFAKPDPAYYAEIAARVGVEPDEALMIGDSEVNDIAPAHALGMQVIQVNQHAPDRLAQARHCVDEVGWFETSAPPILTPGMIEPEMRGNIGALYGTLEGVKPHYWSQRAIPNEWSLLQIVCHLLQSEVDVQLARLLRIRNENNPFLHNAPTPPGPDEFVPCGADGWDIVAQFVERRQETLNWLRQLTSADWSRPARHSTFGLTTLLEMAHFTAQHDRLHINQICQTLGRCE